MPTEAEERIAAVQAQAPNVKLGEEIAKASRETSIAMGGVLAFEGGGPLGLAIYGAGLAGGWAGSTLAESLHTADYLASGLEYLGMHRIGQGGEHPATVDHQVAHSNAFAGFLAAVAIGVVAAVAVTAVVLSGGTALVVIGAAAAGGFATGFLGSTVAGALAQTGTRTGPIITGSPHLLIGGKRVARMTDTANCNRESSPTPIVQGSETILVDGLPMARIGHKLLCGAVIDEGAASVMIDKTVVQCATPEPEVPVWARVAADWIGFLPWGKVSAYLANRVNANKGVIVNDIIGKPRVGSALKNDPVKPKALGGTNQGRPITQEFPATAKGHGWPDIIDNYAGYATKTELPRGATLYQLEGSLNGTPGRFEWITQGGNVTHRQFVHGGTINGVPIKP